MKIDVKDATGVGHYRLLNESIFNIYNVVSAVAVLREIGYSHAQIEAFFAKLNIVGSRYDAETIGSRTLYRLLAKEKNAFATTRVFDYIGGLDGDKEIILMNSCQGDMKHWSENTCWLYDCDFEFLNQDNIKNIVLCGPRRFDYKLRLLQLFANDHIYVLYGTDSIVLGKKVADQVRTLLIAKNKEEGEADEN